MSEHNKYIYKLDNGRLPERSNHHSWPPYEEDVGGEGGKREGGTEGRERKCKEAKVK